jgi:hypothetical protein
MAEFMKDVTIRFGKEDGKHGYVGSIYVDGEEFPWHVTGFDLTDRTADSPVPLLTLTIPVGHTHVIFDSRDVEDTSTPDVVDQLIEFGRPGDITEVSKDADEELDRRFLWRYVKDEGRGRHLIRYDFDLNKWVWLRDEDEVASATFAHDWKVVPYEWPGEYAVVSKL